MGHFGGFSTTVRSHNRLSWMKVWKSFSNPVFTPLQPLKTSSYHRTKSSFCVPLKRKSGSRLQAVSHHLVNLGFRILRSTGGKRNLQQENKALLESKIKSWTQILYNSSSTSQCLKITEKVSLIIARELSSICFLTISEY